MIRPRTDLQPVEPSRVYWQLNSLSVSLTMFSQVQEKNIYEETCVFPSDVDKIVSLLICKDKLLTLLKEPISPLKL